MAVGLVIAVISNIFHYWPQFILLFRQLNTIKE